MLRSLWRRLCLWWGWLAGTAKRCRTCRRLVQDFFTAFADGTRECARCTLGPDVDEVWRCWFINGWYRARCTSFRRDKFRWRWIDKPFSAGFETFEITEPKWREQQNSGEWRPVVSTVAGGSSWTLKH